MQRFCLHLVSPERRFPLRKDGAKFVPSPHSNMVWYVQFPNTAAYQPVVGLFSFLLSLLRSNITSAPPPVRHRSIHCYTQPQPSPPPPIPPHNSLLKRVSSHMLEPPARRGDGDRLIHHPLTDIEVRVDPFLDIFVVGNLVGLETGSRAQMGVVSLVDLWMRRVGRERERELG